MLDSNNPTLFQPSTTHTSQNVLSNLYKKTSEALRTYNQNMTWIKSQLELGNIDRSLLIELNITTQSTSHQTPIELELAKLYIDPKFARIIEEDNNNDNERPGIMMHLAAKNLTTAKLDKTDFPPICNSELSETSISFK